MPRLVSRPAYGALLAAVLLALSAPVRASPLTDQIKAQGGCRAVDANVLVNEVHDADARPFGKPARDWTPDDLHDLRDVLAHCAAHDVPWSIYTESEQAVLGEEADRIVREFSNKLQSVITGQPAPNSYLDAQQRAKDEDLANRLDAVREAGLLRMAHRLADKMGELVVAAPSMPALRVTQLITQLTYYAEQIRTLVPRDPVAQELAQREAQLEQLRVSLQQTAPVTDLDQLGQGIVDSLGNPLLLDKYEAQLRTRGFDLQALANYVFRSGSDWLIELSNQPTPVDQTNGFFCKVSESDGASMAVLETVKPPLAAIRATGPLGSFDVSPTQGTFSVVIAPCTLRAVQ